MTTSSRSQFLRGLVLLVVFAMIAAACGSSTTDTTAASGTSDTTAASGTPDTTAASGTPDTTAAAGPSGDPIVIGSTLALTGFLGPTAAIHKVAGDLFVEQLNANGGLLGRPVEWMVLDDESVPDTAASLYERLITEDGVDAIIGPYGTGTITAAMQVAERYGYVMPQHTGSLTYTYGYDCHFPAWPAGRNPNVTNPELLYDALDSTGTPPESIAFVINQFPGTMYVAYGQPDTDESGAVSLAEDRGYDVVLDINYPSNTTDWGPIAAQVRDADPDFLFLGALGVDGPNLIAAMDALDYQVPGMFLQWPAPGPMLGAGDSADGAMSVTAFEPHAPFTDNPAYAEIAQAFSDAATAAGLPYTAFETQASASWAAWQILVAGIEGAGTTDQAAACAFLQDNTIDTVFGPIQFDPEQNNYYGDLSYIKQIQNGDWVVVWPANGAPDGATVEYSPEG